MQKHIPKLSDQPLCHKNFKTNKMENKKQLQVTPFQQQLPMLEITSLAKAFVESGMFPDIKTMAQAIVKIQAGQEFGIKPFASMTGIHIIAGKPVPGAGIIASRIKASGKYDYTIKEMSDKICSIDFFQGEKCLGNSSFSIEDARRAQTKNLDKFPKNMLFARAISNGVKWFTPDVFDGPVYVEEDFDNVTEDTTAEVQPHAEDKKEALTPTVINNDTQTNKSIPITAPDNKPFVVPGNWYAKVEKWNIIDDAIATYNDKKESIAANPELATFFFTEAMKVCTSKVNILSMYNAAKDVINANPGLQQILKQKQSQLPK